LADALGAGDITARNRAWAEKGLAALETLWSDAHGQYLPFDRDGGKLCQSPSIGGLIPVFAPIPSRRAAAIADTIAHMGATVRYLVPSHAPSDPRFDLKRYWRGPVWLVCNFIIADGLRRADEMVVAERIVTDSLALIERSGFAEYYDPRDGAPLGGTRFSWTAAMVLEFVEPAP
ncbi:MAG TPA: hypothetical protein VIN06_13090, partial [Devosia sp.]